MTIEEIDNKIEKLNKEIENLMNQRDILYNSPTEKKKREYSATKVMIENIRLFCKDIKNQKNHFANIVWFIKKGRYSFYSKDEMIEKLNVLNKIAKDNNFNLISENDFNYFMNFYKRLDKYDPSTIQYFLGDIFSS